MPHALGELNSESRLLRCELLTVTLFERGERRFVLGVSGRACCKWIEPESGGSGGSCRDATAQGELTGLHRPPGTIQNGRFFSDDGSEDAH